MTNSDTGVGPNFAAAHRPQSSSASRFMAGAFGFALDQCHGHIPIEHDDSAANTAWGPARATIRAAVLLDPTSDPTNAELIRRAEGARKFKSRLFSSDEVYKTALKNELVTLGISPSSANDAVNGVWEHWDRNEAPVGQKLYVLMFPSGDNWSVALCSRKELGGPLYTRGKSTRTKSVEMELPKRAFAVIPISDVFERVSSKIARLLGG